MTAQVLQRSSALRDKVFKRDGGVCANPDCRCDTEKLMRAMLAAHEFMGYFCRGKMWWVRSRETLAMLGFPDHFRHMWEADHIVPLSVDGPDTLDSMQTLCHPCHRAKSGGETKVRGKTARLGKKMPGRKYQAHQLSKIKEGR